MFKRKKLLWQIYPPFLLIITAALIIVTVCATISTRVFYIDQTADFLESKAGLFLKLFAGGEKSREKISDNLCKMAGEDMSARITYISSTGRVICDSEENSSKMNNHLNRPEIQSALRKGLGVSVRYSDTLRRDLVYVAAPVRDGEELIGFIRTSTSLTSVTDALRPVYIKIAISGVVVMLFVALITYLVARRINRPLKEIGEGAHRFAAGDLSYRLNIQSPGEIAVLAESMNQMAGQLKKLESIRSDFVANVSHELKTPITAIKGFIETLKEGAIEDPENARHFIEIISKHSDRLGEIIEDLLSLSRIEQESEKDGIQLERDSINTIINAAVTMCMSKAGERGIEIDIASGDDLEINMNSALLEQAIINLIDNAIKYSDGGKKIVIESSHQNGEVLISITDQGYGIPKNHQARIFERFYRIDKSRSRSLGGTGLGLAIVKHIVSAHNGRITLESKPGSGSKFTIHLPA